MIQMIYASGASHPFTPAELAKLLTNAREKNREAGITGMLVYENGAFLQVIEGEEDAVEALFDRISNDGRHGQIRMLLRSEITERSFPEWTMGFVNRGKLAIDPPDGFRDFFQRGGDFSNVDADRAKTVLMQFRKGRWHQHVESDEATGEKETNERRQANDAVPV